MPYGEKSPAEMGHKSPMKKESAKQETKNLLDENPVDNKASAMQMGHESPMKMAGSWMSKHSMNSRMGSPLKGHCMGSAAKMGHDSPAEFHAEGHKQGIKETIVGTAKHIAKKYKEGAKKSDAQFARAKASEEATKRKFKKDIKDKGFFKAVKDNFRM